MRVAKQILCDDNSMALLSHKSPLRLDKCQRSAGEIEQLGIVDVLRLPRRVRIVMKPVRVFRERAEFVDVRARKQLVWCPDALFAKTDERSE